MVKKHESKFKSMVNANAKKQQSQGSNYGYLILPKGVDIFTPEPGGKATLDIIPYTVTDEKHPDRDSNLGIAVPGELWYKRPFKIHRNIGADKDAVVCLTSFGKRCPICEYRNQMIKNGAKKEETDLLKPSLRNLYVVIPVGNKKNSGQPMIWDISQFLFQNLLNDELEENEDYAVFPDLEEGLSLKIRFDSKTIGGGNAFAEASRIDFISRNNPYDESILDEVPNLDKVLQELSAKELEAKFMEMDPDDVETEEEEEEDDEEEEIPVRKKKEGAASKSNKKAPVDDEDEEEDEEEEEEEDEEEEPTPVRRKKAISPEPKPKRKPIVVEEDEEEEDEEIEEEEDEKPVKKSVSKKTEPSKKEKGGKLKCPHGHKFGDDCEKYFECDDCELWGECADAKG